MTEWTLIAAGSLSTLAGTVIGAVLQSRFDRKRWKRSLILKIYEPLLEDLKLCQKSVERRSTSGAKYAPADGILRRYVTQSRWLLASKQIKRLAEEVEAALKEYVAANNAARRAAVGRVEQLFSRKIGKRTTMPRNQFAFIFDEAFYRIFSHEFSGSPPAGANDANREIYGGKVAGFEQQLWIA